MSLFKPDWERAARVIYAVGDMLVSGKTPEGLSKDDERTVKITAAALERVTKGIVAVVKRHKG